MRSQNVPEQVLAARSLRDGRRNPGGVQKRRPCAPTLVVDGVEGKKPFFRLDDLEHGVRHLLLHTHKQEECGSLAS